MKRGLLTKILTEGLVIKDPFEAYAEACYMIEKELHQTITPDYPVAKFMAEIELLNEDYKRRKMELDRLKHRGLKR